MYGNLKVKFDYALGEWKLSKNKETGYAYDWMRRQQHKREEEEKKRKKLEKKMKKLTKYRKK